MMKIIHCLAFSDTHNQHDLLKLPPTEVLISCGDATAYGTLEEFKNFLIWFGKQIAIKKYYVPGNHDIGLVESDRSEIFRLAKENNITILEDTEEIYKGVKFYGFPWTPSFGNWQYAADGANMQEKVDQIPSDTNILISHGPPYEILDKINKKQVNMTMHMQRPGEKFRGCKILAKKIREINPEVCTFGHIHNDGGKHIKNTENGKETIYANVASMRGYKGVQENHYQEFDIHYESKSGRAIIDYIDFK